MNHVIEGSMENRAIGRLPIGRIALGVVGIILLIILGRQGASYLQGFAQWVDGLGAWGPIVFIIGYAVATVAFVPGLLLTVAAGAIFGILQGSIYVFVGATLGSSAAFLVSRYLARSAIERRLGGNQKFAAIDRAIGGQGFKIVFLLRLSPVFPFNLLNYGLGLTKVRFVDYLLAAVGMIPGSLLYVYTGKLAGDVAALAGGATAMHGPGYYTVWILGLGTTVAVTALVTRLARRALNEATGDTEPPLSDRCQSP